MKDGACQSLLAHPRTARSGAGRQGRASGMPVLLCGFKELRKGRASAQGGTVQIARV